MPPATDEQRPELGFSVKGDAREKVKLRREKGFFSFLVYTFMFGSGPSLEVDFIVVVVN